MRKTNEDYAANFGEVRRMQIRLLKKMISIEFEKQCTRYTRRRSMPRLPKSEVLEQMNAEDFRLCTAKGEEFTFVDISSGIFIFTCQRNFKFL